MIPARGGGWHPLHNVQTLTIFVVVSIGSIAVMVGAGVAGSYIIRRIIKPLRSVSRGWRRMWRTWDLEERRFHRPVRVEPRYFWTLAPRSAR